MLLDTTLATGHSRPRTGTLLRHGLNLAGFGSWLTAVGAVTAGALAIASTMVEAHASSLLADTAPSVQWKSESPAILHIDSVTTTQNRLAVNIAHKNGSPVRGDIAISVNGERPTLIHGTSLPEGGDARIFLDDVAVQRRGRMDLEVRTADGRSIQKLSAIVAPDAPNDLELASAHVGSDGVLVADVRNNSPIPLRGTIRIAAREPAFPYTLLAWVDAALEVNAGGSQHVRVGHVGPIDVHETWIGLTTDAIADADIGNNVLAR